MKQKIKKFRDFWNYIFQGSNTALLLMCLVFIIKSSFNYFQPIFMGRLVDIVLLDSAHFFPKLIFYGSIMIVLVIQNYITHPLYIKYQSKISRGLSHRLRIEICRKLQQLSLLQFNKTRSGKIHSKLLRDVDVIEGIPRAIPELILSSILNLIVIVGVCIVKSPMILLVFLLIVPCAIGLQKIFRKRLKENSQMYRKNIEEMSANLSDMINMMPVTRAHGLEENEMKTAHEKITDVYKKGQDFDIVGAKFGSAAWVSFTVMQTVFLLIIVYFCFMHKISVGDILVFNSFFGTLIGSISMLLYSYPMFVQMKESIKSVNEILNTPEVENNTGKKKITSPMSKYEFQDVSFNYPGTDLM